jgi:hypothetical protein
MRGVNAALHGSFWRPGVVLPSQTPQQGAQAQCGEIRLASAILEDALRCIRKNAAVRRGPRAKEFREARRWFANQSRDWPFAFANVCDLLALDPGAVRKRVERIVADTTSH